MALPLHIDTLNLRPVRRIDTGVHQRPTSVARATQPTRLSEAVYRRRRIAVAAATVLVLSLGMLVVRSINATGARVLPTVPVAQQEVPSGTTADAAGTLRGQAIRRGGTYVAQRGDTLWIIARALKPEGDVTGLLRQLVRLNGGPSLEVGQVVRLPR